MSRALAAAALLAALGACRAKAGASEAPPESTQPDAAEAERVDAAPEVEEPAFSSCNAPSVKLLRAYDDARSLAALARCLPDGGGYAPGFDGGYEERMTLEQPVVNNCGQKGFERDPDVPRIIDSALPFDSQTTTHVRSLFATGKARGRRADVFALVGDSITIDYSFMKPFSWTSNMRVRIDPRLREAISIDDGRRTVIDLFRGAEPPDARDASLGPDGALPGKGSTYFDAFWSVRAAKIGARANWAVTPDSAGSTPVKDVVDQLSPAYAIVMYGTNDAEWYLTAPDKVGKLFGEQLRKVVDLLEAEGVIPILSTIAKHMHDKRFADCSPEYDAITNARYMIQTNAVSAEVAAIACERHLPLVDFRYAIDPLLNHGVAGDGVHPSVYQPLGGGMLDEAGLQCGFNVRNAVTLRMLKMLYDVTKPRALKR